MPQTEHAISCVRGVTCNASHASGQPLPEIHDTCKIHSNAVSQPGRCSHTCEWAPLCTPHVVEVVVGAGGIHHLWPGALGSLRGGRSAGPLDAGGRLGCTGDDAQAAARRQGLPRHRAAWRLRGPETDARAPHARRCGDRRPARRVLHSNTAAGAHRSVCHHPVHLWPRMNAGLGEGVEEVA